MPAANHVHLLEPSPDPAVLVQAVGRVDRLGQTRPVHVYRYIMTGTIEVGSPAQICQHLWACYLHA